MMGTEAERLGTQEKLGLFAAGNFSPGEFIHYQMNLLTLLRDVRDPLEIDEIAHAAIANRVSAMQGFSKRLLALREYFLKERTRLGRTPEHAPPPLLEGWHIDRIHKTRAENGGLLIALFHFGEHRQVFADLACLGVPYVSPVAKQAYFECNELLKHGPPDFESAMKLLEVEDRRVGRRMLQELRAGRIGLIYVDGNMGPDGHLVEEGAFEVNFLGCCIRVKAGIARLSQSLAIPVLPIMVHGTFNASADPARVVMGDLIPAPRKGDSDGSQRALMQRVYDELEAAVRSNPEKWEFAFCFHRWIVASPDGLETESSSIDFEIAERALVEVSPRDVVLYSRDGSDFWVHIGSQKAYRMPIWAEGLHALLAKGESDVVATMDWLQARGASSEDAVTFLRGLLRRGLAAIVEPVYV